ncbi:hypothetical protein FACS1894124_7460 [Spirochaetia bacterium]|nr:hypothetical protein FACS1894124_7460 [Spirochaetia bacterium]
MKRYDMDEEVEGLTFWPLDDLQAAFAAVETDTQDGGELYALRRFHRWMQYFEKTAGGKIDIELAEEAVIYAYERPALERDLAAMRCGACPVDTCPSAASGLPGETEATAADPAPVMKQRMDSLNHADGINAVEFYPAERVDEIFSRMKAALNTPREVEELKIFALRMDRLYENQAKYTCTWLDQDEYFDTYAEKEAVEDAAFVRKITGGRP